jgi:hypothetical protein
MQLDFISHVFHRFEGSAVKFHQRTFEADLDILRGWRLGPALGVHEEAAMHIGSILIEPLLVQWVLVLKVPVEYLLRVAKEDVTSDHFALVVFELILEAILSVLVEEIFSLLVTQNFPSLTDSSERSLVALLICWVFGWVVLQREALKSI